MEEKGQITKEAGSSTRAENYQSEDYREKIKALYGLDIKLNDSNKSIVEQAHPYTVVVAPSYDRMNGVVENIQERHNVMTGIARKPTNGNLTQHRYAKKELMDELIRLGFDLDNEGEEDLAKIATIAAVQLSNEEEITKTAFLPAAGAVLASPWFWGGVAAVTGWVAVKKNVIGYIDQGVKNDTQRVIESLESLAESVEGNDQATVSRYISAFQKFLHETQRALDILSRADPDVVKLENSDDVIKAKKRIVGTKQEIQFARKYLKTCKFVAKSIGSTVSVQSITGSKSALRGVIPTISRMNVVSSDVESDWWQSVQSVWQSTFGSDPKTHAINSLSSLRDSIKSLLENYRSESQSAASEAKNESKSAFEAFQKATSGGPTTNDDPNRSGLEKYVRF
jgi:hypothetical protein